VIPGLGGGGGFSASASSGASSGPTSQGNQGVQIGGIQTGGTQGIDLTMLAVVGAVVLVALLLIRKR
jgi:LPXTG-motif cell wall-anchored protein